jgi:hypothetical protein
VCYNFVLKEKKSRCTAVVADGEKRPMTGPVSKQIKVPATRHPITAIPADDGSRHLPKRQSNLTSRGVPISSFFFFANGVPISSRASTRGQVRNRPHRRKPSRNRRPIDRTSPQASRTETARNHAPNRRAVPCLAGRPIRRLEAVVSGARGGEGEFRGRRRSYLAAASL